MIFCKRNATIKQTEYFYTYIITKLAKQNEKTRTTRRTTETIIIYDAETMDMVREK